MVFEISVVKAAGSVDIISVVQLRWRKNGDPESSTTQETFLPPLGQAMA